MIKEQRQTNRHPRDSSLYYTYPGKNERVTGRCVNLSNSGILLECQQLVQPDTAISVCLFSDNETIPSLNMLVKIIWGEKQSSGHHLMGATIKAIMAAQDIENV